MKGFWQKERHIFTDAKKIKEHNSTTVGLPLEKTYSR